jgi:hypothetical protein
MDFSSFKRVATANTRKGGTITKEQTYEDMKYRRTEKEIDGKKTIEGRFYVSNARYNEWNLDAKKGLVQFDGPNGEAVVALVAEADATVLKSKENAKKKGKNFKSVLLEAKLEKLGVITTSDSNLENQFLKLNLVGENLEIDGVKCEKVYTLTKGEKKAVAKKEKAVVASDAAPVKATAEAAAAPTAKADWD